MYVCICREQNIEYNDLTSILSTIIILRFLFEAALKGEMAFLSLSIILLLRCWYCSIKAVSMVTVELRWFPFRDNHSTSNGSSIKDCETSTWCNSSWFLFRNAARTTKWLLFIFFGHLIPMANFHFYFVPSILFRRKLFNEKLISLHMEAGNKGKVDVTITVKFSWRT